MKWVPDIAKLKSCFNSRFVTFSCGLFSKISSTAISIVSCKGMLVKRLQASHETKKLSLPLTCCISSQKLNESLGQCSLGITESRSSVRNLARLIISAYGRNNWLQRKVLRIK